MEGTPKSRTTNVAATAGFGSILRRNDSDDDYDSDSYCSFET